MINDSEAAMVHSSLRWVALLLTAFSIVAPTLAQDKYPSRPIRMIVPYPPGGSTDPTGRAFAAWLTEALGQQVVVDNRPGAGSTIGHGLGAKATPDGYTLLLGTSGGLAVSPALNSKLPYDPVRDFTPIGLGVYTPFLLVVHAGLPAASLKEFIALSKAQSGGIVFASVGVEAGHRPTISAPSCSRR